MAQCLRISVNVQRQLIQVPWPNYLGLKYKEPDSEQMVPSILQVEIMAEVL